MSFLKSIFTWWDGATIGTALFSRRHGQKAGEDSFGNIYYESKKPIAGVTRRWVIYNGSNDASRVDPEWRGWLHGTFEEAPDKLPPPRAWQKSPAPNLTGTPLANLPAGALDAGGRRVSATGDYEAWSPS